MNYMCINKMEVEWANVLPDNDGEVYTHLVFRTRINNKSNHLQSGVIDRTNICPCVVLVLRWRSAVCVFLCSAVLEGEE